MSKTHEIPHERWGDYLNALSNREKERPVRIQVEGRELGDQVVAHDLPLMGISLERKGSEKGAIEVTLADREAIKLTHLIAAPERVYVEENDAGEVQVLDIESREQVKTLIFFETAMTAGV